MGISYEGLLVVGELDMVVDALADERVTAFVAQAAPGRVAVVPKGDPRWGDIADTGAIAERLSGGHGLAVLAHEMYDSDRLTLLVYERGAVAHEYVSEMGSVGDVEETSDGFVRVVDGVTYALGDPAAPRGPRGADPDRLLPFGVGTVDRDRLGQLLVSARDHVFADELHIDILLTLNLGPDPLTTRYRWVERGDVELEAVHVTPATGIPWLDHAGSVPQVSTASHAVDRPPGGAG